MSRRKSGNIRMSVATTPTVKAALVELAERDGRSLSALGGLLLTQALRLGVVASGQILPESARPRWRASGRSEQPTLPTRS